MNEAQIQEMLYHGDEIFAIWGPNGRMIDVNVQTLDFFGFSSKQDFHESYDDLSPLYQPDGKTSKETMLQNIKRALEEGAADFDWLHKKRDGGHVDCQIKMVSGEYAEEKVVCAFIRSRFSDGAQPPPALPPAVSQAGDYFREILEHAPVACYMYDKNFQVIDLNQHVVKLHARDSKAEMNRSSILDCAPEFQPNGERSPEYSARELTKAFHDGIARTPWVAMTKDGRKIVCDCVAVRIEYRDEPALLVYLRETERGYEAVKQSHEQRMVGRRIQTMLDSVPVLCQFFVDGKIIEVNNAAVDMFGIPDKRVYLENLYDFSPEYQPDGTPTREKVEQFYKLAIDTGRVTNLEWMHKASDGTLIPCEVSLERVKLGKKHAVLAFARDMREYYSLKKMQETERERVQAMLDSSPMHCSIFDKDGNCLDVNQAALEFFGFTHKQQYIDNFHLLAPEYQPDGSLSNEKIRENNKDLIEGKIEGGKLLYKDWIQQTLDGEQRPVDVTLVHIKLGGEDAIIAHARDLRTEKAMLAELEAARKIELEMEAMTHSRQIYDSNPICASLWDEDLNILFCNDATVKCLELSCKEDYTERFHQYVPEYQPNGVSTVETIQLVREKVKNDGHFNAFFALLSSKKELVPGEITVVSIAREGGNYFAVYFQDHRQINAAMQRERELELKLREQQLNERVQAMFDAAPIMVEYWDKELNSIDCNQSVLEYFGFSEKEEYYEYLIKETCDEHIGKTFRDVWDVQLRSILETGYGSFEYLDIKPNGQVIPLEVRGVRTEIGGETIVLTYSSDVSAIHEAQKERQRMEVAEEANRAKTRFLARMSHEIRTPITAVLGISEIQLRKPETSPEMEEVFAKIYDSSNLLLKIVNDILDFSKVETGNMPVISQEYDVASLIGDTTQLHMVYLDDKNFTFQMFVDENLPAMLIGDGLRLRQIMNNLLSNAFKYTVEGSVSLSLHAEKCADDENIMLVISIRDTGLGMTKAQLGTLGSNMDFHRFHERTNISGAGLGLPIVFSFLQMMDGRIDFESEVGKGTSVTVRIPQKISGDGILGKETAERLAGFKSVGWSETVKHKFVPEPMPYGKVLVVDDVEANLYVAHGLLAFYGLQIESCDSGHAAIEKIKNGNMYDVVLMDYMMPGLNGTETMRKMRALGYSAPVVALTANALIGQAEEFIKNGFDDFISKPIQTLRLNEILIKYIRDKQPPEILEAARAANRASDDIVRFQFSPEVQKKLRSDFSRSQKNAMRDIRRSLAADDAETAYLLTHNLKGLAGLIEEAALMRIVQEIESPLRDGTLPTEAQLASLEKELSRVLEKIGPSQSSEIFGEKVLDKEKAAELFDELEPLLKSNNVDAQDFLDELRAIPESGILVKQIEMFEFSVALSSLNALRAVLDL